MNGLFVPTVGAAYKLFFEQPYDAMNGVYKIVKILTYDEYVEDGRNLLDDFYVPCGLGSDQLAADLDKIRESKILKLNPASENESADTNTYYAPLDFLTQNADYNVKCYQKYALLTYIGFLDNVEILEDIRSTIFDRILATTGIDVDPQIVTVGETWMSEDDYNKIVSEREEVQTDSISYFSENKRLLKENANLRSKLEALTQLVIAQQEQLDKRKG